jgi:methyl-accepting chemotaxis protein
MTNLTIRLKLRIIFLCLAGLFLAFGLMSLSRLSDLNVHLGEMGHDILPAILASNTMNTELSDFRAKEGMHALTHDLSGMDAIEKSLAFHQSEIEKARKILEPLIFNQEEKSLYADFVANYAKYLSEHDKFIQISRRDELDDARNQLVLMAPIFEHLSLVLDRIVSLKRETALAEISESHEVYIHGVNRTLIAGFVVLALVIGCILLLERTVSRSIQTLAEEIARIGEGDFAVTISGQERGDEVGRISRAAAATVAAIQGTVGGLNRLIGDIRAGSLSERADPRAFRGEFATLLTGVNELIEAMSRPLIEVAEVMQKLASGKLEGRMTGLYEGDLRALKANVNRSLDTLAALLGELATTAQRLAVADLRQGIEGNYQGTFAEVRANVNQALIQLRELAGEAALGTEQSSVATTQTAAAARQVAQSSARQMGVLNEIVAAIQETANSVSSVAAHAANGSALATTAADLAASGRTELSALVTEVDHIAARHGRIDQITATITRIADKTQVLSINAAIEAARAGAEGRGFGVVAHQIGRLAEEAARAAADIGTIISEASEGVKSSVAGVAGARAAMERMTVAVDQSGIAAQAIAAAIAQQSAAIQLVSRRLNELEQEGQSNAGAAEEISATMEELSRIIHRTRAQVARFTLA